MIDRFVSFVIRPPRAEYNPDDHLWEKDFTLAYRKYKREDLELKNERGHRLRCSHYVPAKFLDNVPLPCVIYCHGNSGCRVDAKEAVVFLLPFNITVFTLDFSGSGLSDGDYVSLGWHEKNDLKVVVSYLRTNEKVSRIGIWGRSMGAVTSLLYGAEDPLIAGMVLDSAFSNLFNLMIELADMYKVRLPKFTVKMLLLFMRQAILKKAKFDIMRIDCLRVAPKTCIPALFGHGKDDRFVKLRHTDAIFNLYTGNKNIIKFKGDHNSNRPGNFHKSVTKFFCKVLLPPRLPSPYASKLGQACIERNLLFRSVSAHATSSSSAPQIVFNTKSDIAIFCEDKPSGLKEESCSFTSSNRGSWGSCSSLGSNGAHARLTKKYNKSCSLDDENKKKSIAPIGTKKSKLEKFETISQCFRLCLPIKINNRRRYSSS